MCSEGCGVIEEPNKANAAFDLMRLMAFKQTHECKCQICAPVMCLVGTV